MNTMKKLSVLITCYNCKDFIDKAISSVFDQKIPYEWELLIGDDGSNDGTLDIIQSWIEKYPNIINLFVMKRDEGAVMSGTRAARNRANLLQNASGEYIAFLDGDDQLLGDCKFANQISLLDSELYSECACSAHNIIVNNTQDKTIEPMVKNMDSIIVVSGLDYWGNMYFHTNTIVFRSICKEMMLSPQFRDFLNDNFITYIILQYGSILYLPDCYAQYNITGNGLWTGKRRAYGCFRNVILYDLELRINKDFKNKAFRRHLYDFVYLHRKYKKHDDDVQLLIKELAPNDFPFTFLLEDVDFNLFKSLKREVFCLRAEMLSLILRISHIPQKMIKRRSY